MAPLMDCLPPSVTTSMTTALKPLKAPVRRKRRRSRIETPVHPAELLLDDNGVMHLSVGEVAMPIASLGGEAWPLPTELVLLLDPALQAEVQAKVEHVGQ